MERQNDIEIDPEYAQKLLDANEENRKLPTDNRDRYTRDMKNGKWYNIGDPIRVDWNGKLMDGQTRLTAVIRSDTTQLFDLITGMDPALKSYIDTGKSRSPGDVFHMSGITNANVAAAVAKLVLKYKLGMVADNRTQIPHHDLLAFAEHNGHKLYEACKAGEDIRRAIGLKNTVSGTVYFLASEVADPFDVNFFFARLLDGIFMTPGNPIHTFRQFIIRRQKEDGRATDRRINRVTRTEYLWYMMHAWNTWASGESITRIQAPKGGIVRSDQFPTLLPVLTGVIPEGIREEGINPVADNLVIKEGGGGKRGK